MNAIIQKIIYPVITLIVLIAIGLLVFQMARFFTEKINGAFFIDQASVEANLGKVNIEQYKLIAPRFGIDTSNIQ